MLKRLFIFLLLLVILPVLSSAQSWQWGERGGSTDDSYTGGATSTENVVDISTDINGNLYVLTNNVGPSSLNIAGVPKITNGSSDVMLASFTCNGILRWVKMIGGEKGDHGVLLKTDKKDGVYFVFKPRFSSSSHPSGIHYLHFDKDTTIIIHNTGGTYYNWKDIFIAKYDTAGKFQWMVTPETDTVTFSNTQSPAYDMDVDSFGNIDLLCNLQPGGYGTPNTYKVNQYGTHILKYDANGLFKGGVGLEIFIDSESVPYAFFRKDTYNMRYIISGTQGLQPVYIQNKKMVGEKYIGSFHLSGDLDWYRNDTTILFFDGLVGRPALDDSGNIYVIGSAYMGKSFNGFTPSSKYSEIMIMKMDKRGNMLWASDAWYTTAAIGPKAIALRNSGEVVLTGHTVGTTKWKTGIFEDSVKTPDAVYRPFIARFNTQTGKLLGMDDIVTEGNNGYPEDLISDGRNNIYIGGKFGGRIIVNGKRMASVGGHKDFYVAKYGHSNCNCRTFPEPSFDTVKAGNFSYKFTYTGTKGTVEWDFGDGTTSTLLNPTHTYTWLDDFYACVTVTDSCGDNIYCTKISTKWPQNIINISGGKPVHIYPNPVGNLLHIKGLVADTKIEIYDIVGKLLDQAVAYTDNTTINVGYLAEGNYVIRLNFPDGMVRLEKFTKL
jgi:hypothetical protein